MILMVKCIILVPLSCEIAIRPRSLELRSDVQTYLL